MERDHPDLRIGDRDPQLDVRELLEQAGDIVYALDLEGRFTYFNRAGFEVFRVPLSEWDEWIGRPFADLLTPESQRTALEHFRRGVEGEEITPFFEVEGRRRDGTLVQLEIRASAVHRDGLLVGRQGIARDITELKALQAEVREKSERLGLLESQNRLAMEVYRRLTQLNLDALEDPSTGTDALGRFTAVLAESAASQLGLDSVDLEIIGLVSRGASNQEIAGEVYLSPNTVKDRISKVMRVLGTSRRAELVAEASRRGLLSLSATGGSPD